jgi:hypothetical protein
VQSQFIDLCHLLDEPIPSDADPTGTWYAFEKGANKATATQFESRHHLSKLQAVVVENSLDVTRVVMEYLTKKLPNLVVAMPK